MPDLKAPSSSTSTSGDSEARGNGLAGVAEPEPQSKSLRAAHRSHHRGGGIAACYVLQHVHHRHRIADIDAATRTVGAVVVESRSRLSPSVPPGRRSKQQRRHGTAAGSESWLKSFNGQILRQDHRADCYLNVNRSAAGSRICCAGLSKPIPMWWGCRKPRWKTGNSRQPPLKRPATAP